MKTMLDTSFSSRASAFTQPLTFDALRERAPAVFANGAHERTSSKYTFIPTERVLSGLMSAGFVPMDVRQAQTRTASPLHARHILRLRRRFETVQLKDSIPEIVFLNSHDGTSAYQLRMGLYRVVCTNGLIVSHGAFPAYCVSHRGDVVDEVVTGALKISEQFEGLAHQVERMEERAMFIDEQIAFAERALALRFPVAAESGMQPSQQMLPKQTGLKALYGLTQMVQHLSQQCFQKKADAGVVVRPSAPRLSKAAVRILFMAGGWVS